MPSCFSLTRKGETEPSNLADVDDAICKHFGVETDPDQYYAYWYDSIGFLLAIGRSFNQIEVMHNTWIAQACLVRDYEMAESDRIRRSINAYLRENYISNAWREFK